jgi:hypothetical protein
MSSRYYIPNTLENWKWPRRLNPHYPEVKALAESVGWIRSFEAFSPRAQYAFDRGQFGTSLAAVLCNPAPSLTSHQTSSPALRILPLTRVCTCRDHMNVPQAADT